MNEVALGIIVMTLLVLLLLAGIVIAFFVGHRQRINQQLIIAANKQDFERELRIVEIQAREKVIHQISQDLHDNIGQLLTASHLQIQTIKTDHPEQKEALLPVELYLRDAQQQLRLFSKTLNQDFVLQHGLDQALLSEAQRLSALKRFPVVTQIASNGSPFDKEKELMIFRIFQEVIQNVLKHAHPKNLQIQLHSDNNSFELIVTDDGIGFDLNETLKSNNGSGLRNMEKRAALAAIECIISSNPGKGTTVILKKSAN